ncbi:tetratricopeptide repeat protein [Labrenzia sp. CE80]|uniref:tetratricopeptide repeat protein n=1 Tax=Labrenzia sp. CE80 TaxID=1788986 RepID=UPI001AD93AE3|nr:tetratricopeptide repeat protein [Labrenzia sp. CE80]
MEKMHKALAYQKQGEIEKAQRLYKQVLKKVPSNPDANHLLGVCYRQLGFPKRALEFIQKAIKLADDRAPFYANLARTMSDLPGTTPESTLAVTQKALSLDPTIIEAQNLQAVALSKLERLEEAEEILQRLIGRHPEHPDAYRNYGILLRNNGDYDKAAVFFFKCTQLDPANPENYIQRARARHEANQLKENDAELRKALELFPDNGDLHHELARNLFKQSRTFEGLPHAEFAVKQDPTNHHKLVTLGVHHNSLGTLSQAIEAYKAAQAVAPEPLPVVDWNLSLAYLGIGELASGWDLHRARFLDTNTNTLCRKFDKPEWNGESLSGKSIMLWPDQGLGDALRGGTMIPDLLETGAHVIVELVPKAQKAFAYSFPEIEVRTAAFDQVTKMAEHHDYHYHCALADLGKFYRRSHDDFAKAKFPAFSFDAKTAREYLHRLNGDKEKPIVGIGWRSKNLTENRARYYLSAPEISPILEFDDVIYVNLQYLSIERERAYLAQKYNFRHLDDVDLFDDIHAAAALTACCDLVISANTSVADIAGSYGIPCWRFGPPEAIIMLGKSYIPWDPLTKHVPISEEEPAVAIVPRLKDALNTWLETFSPDERNARLGL